MAAQGAFPEPHRGASLMLAFRPKLTLIIGSNKLAATRAFAALEADSRVAILARGDIEATCEELKWRTEHGEVEMHDFADFAVGTSSNTDTGYSDSDIREITALEFFLDSHPPGSVSLVFITDTLLTSDPSTRRTRASATNLYDVCRKRNIPVNVTDIPDLCNFTVCSSHRFTENGEVPTPLQVGVTTNGQGCRLASRIRREIVARLPLEVGPAVQKLGQLRRLTKSESLSAKPDAILDAVEDAENELNEEITVSSPNRPVSQRTQESYRLEEENEAQRSRRRMKWVAQISEYWSFKQLANLTEEDMRNLLAGDLLSPKSSNPSSTGPTSTSTEYPFPSQHGLSLTPPPLKLGCVFLVGSGPGHPSLLTLAAHQALTSLADLILSDKLVPSAILSLIPAHIPLHIARKFPGNAEGAQQELMDMALTAAREGKTVVRLKQGDPAMYGRVGEEVLFLRKHGVECLVVPGISSALAAPLFAGIPVTQRGAADSLAVATGVGRGGAKGRLPGYERARTLVLMMGNARLESLVHTLISGDNGTFAAYPPNVPAAIIERASMPDQRVITAPLSDIVPALESVGEQRPPGLLVVGWAVLSLWGEGDMSVLDDVAQNDGGSEEMETKDRERIAKWLDGRRWRISEGLDALWDTFKVPVKEDEEKQ
ncbi:MET1 [Sanghuangporus vaninii]